MKHKDVVNELLSVNYLLKYKTIRLGWRGVDSTKVNFFDKK
jgi:hypothetical protein